MTALGTENANSSVTPGESPADMEIAAPAAVPVESSTDALRADRASGTRRELGRSNLVPILFLVPAGIGILLFVLLPAVLSLVASFFTVPLAGGPWTWVGLANFERVLTDPAVLKAIGNTLVYSAITIVPSLAIGLALALLANSVGRGRPFVRTALFLPMTANLVAMAVVFRWLFAFQGGFVNQLLGVAGIGAVNWLGDTNTSLLTVALVGIWRSASFSMMIFFAGLATVPGTIHEATKAEGIRGFTKLTRITLPIMKPTVVFATVLAILSSVQVFDTVNVMTQGGPQGSTETVLTMSWKLGFSYFDLGAASALSFLLLVVLVGIGLLQRRILSGGHK
ncbi:carbohydrate ABC transporter permease [Herbiconiux ginsengi]|uniref:Carbohydrate ABC transporter membrane protein 1, CUT1 family n=1 Tax=Herbiconiux ginsengi TaxID=381665 RepID=A0A1H3KK08_9MICO|nr:sugar ABC transporter permease [Herbiconiux ginsengi]SDY52483.1 carbohydrate ABC transporter membrane protein 1, CUT1 family [Herbiconiux ginsengi]